MDKEGSAKEVWVLSEQESEGKAVKCGVTRAFFKEEVSNSINSH
jgi:hypothetical protein